MKIFYTDLFRFPLPAGHSFPIEKYSLLRKRIIKANPFRREELCIPQAATHEQITRAHDPVYLHRLQGGELTPQEIRRTGFPWSAEIVERAKRSSGATIEACRCALTEGVAVNLAGGTHHAFKDRGEGYCLLNDSVIASRTIQAEGLARNILIVDCDAHQGNGTAAILGNDLTIFTFSIHGRNNFPYHKEKSDLDIALDEGTGDAEYLRVLTEGLFCALERAGADIVIYLAGADPYKNDRFGRLSLSKVGLAERDRIVFQHCFEAGIPVAVTMAGGYARKIEDTVDIHFKTITAAAELANGKMFVNVQGGM